MNIKTAPLKFRSINKTLILIILMASFLFASASTLVSFWVDYSNEKELQRSIISQIERTMVGSISKAAWYLDDAQLEQNVRGILEFDDVVEATVSDSAGKVLIVRSKDQINTEMTQKAYPLTFPLYQGDEPLKKEIGKLSITLTRYFLYKRLKEKLIVIFFIETTKILLLSITLLSFFNIFVTKALAQMSSFFRLERTNKTKPHSTLSITRKFTRNRDEIDELVDEYNKLSQLIYETENQLREELVQKENALNQLSRLASLGEMAGNLGHEINNPLAILFGHVHKLKRSIQELGSSKREEIHQQIVKMESVCQRIEKTTKGLTVLMRQSKDEERSQQVLGNVVDEIISLTQEKMRSKGVRFEKLLDDPSFPIHCNRIQIGQVLINLLNNSIHAVQRSENPWIRIEATSTPSCTSIRVIDSGPGIPIENRKNIFIPFFTTKAVGEGTGLGLSVASKIVGAHGGRLYLDEKAYNTTFVIELPKAPKQTARTAA